MLTHICAKFSRLRRKGVKPPRFRAHYPGRRSNPAADLERTWALVYLSSRWSVGRTARCARVPFQPPSLAYPAPNKFNPLLSSPGLLSFRRGEPNADPTCFAPPPTQIHSFGVQPLTPREGETGFTIVRAPQGGYLADTDGWGSSANSEFLREVSMASQRQQRQPETTTTDETGAASEAAPTPPDESPDSSVAIARSGPYGRAAGVPTRVTRFLAVTATPRPGQERPENPSPPRPRSRFPMMTRMYNYMRGRSSSSSSSSVPRGRDDDDDDVDDGPIPIPPAGAPRGVGRCACRRGGLLETTPPPPPHRPWNPTRRRAFAAAATRAPPVTRARPATRSATPSSAWRVSSA